VFAILGWVERRELAYDGKGARQVRGPDGQGGGKWLRRWDPVWILIGEEWRIGILRCWIRPAPGAGWLVQVEFGEPRATALFEVGFFVYDPAHIRPLRPTLPES